nr:hypothetical protein Iba_chr11dCG13360 [Ipomoea batatas]
MAPPNHAVTTLATLAALTHVAAAVMSSISLGFARSYRAIVTSSPINVTGANKILTSLCHNKSISPPNSSTENVSSPYIRTLDLTFLRALPSKIFYSELRSHERWLGGKMTTLRAETTHNMIEPPHASLITVYFCSAKQDNSSTYSPIPSHALFTNVPSLKNLKERNALVAYTNNASNSGFTNAWSSRVPFYTQESYPDLATQIDLLCARGSHDHQMYDDLLLLHQLSDGLPLEDAHPTQPYLHPLRNLLFSLYLDRDLPGEKNTSHMTSCFSDAQGMTLRPKEPKEASHKLEYDLNQLLATQNTLLEEHNTLRNNHSHLKQEHEALEGDYYY